eukprot:EG_transcript_17674
MHDCYIRRLVRRGIDHLATVMVEISMEHLIHPNNHIPHFPKYVLGSLDTFPLVVENGPNRYQPKYKSCVVKFQGAVSNLGLLAFLSGPHPGAMSDTTLARNYVPPYASYGLENCYLLADLAYTSLPHLLPPYKGIQTPQQARFTQIHQWYRARAEHYFADLHNFNIIDSPYRGRDFRFLKNCVIVLCSCQNVARAFAVRYPPYTAIA